LLQDLEQQRFNGRDYFIELLVGDFDTLALELAGKFKDV
jgi:hypothetical protein